ncbi:MAG: hypothetical protein LC789_00395 [Actinobacteria bacterium]|nr:hypothetical protein [Actinomycetota bacterium]MCA1719680.1 hypothetical protein [Actinomycetota bacterium]
MTLPGGDDTELLLLEMRRFLQAHERCAFTVTVDIRAAGVGTADRLLRGGTVSEEPEAPHQNSASASCSAGAERTT